MYTLKRKGMEDSINLYEDISCACMIYRKRNNRDMSQLFFCMLVCRGYFNLLV